MFVYNSGKRIKIYIKSMKNFNYMAQKWCIEINAFAIIYCCLCQLSIISVKVKIAPKNVEI